MRPPMKCATRVSDSASLEDDFDGNRLDPPTGIGGRLERVRSRGAQENGERSENPDNDQALDEDEQASIQANLTSTGALRDSLPGWGPDGYSYPSVNEGGVVEASDPPAGTDQPVDDIAHIINHFRFNRIVSEGELRQNHIYLVSKYGSYVSRT